MGRGGAVTPVNVGVNEVRSLKSSGAKTAPGIMLPRNIYKEKGAEPLTQASTGTPTRGECLVLPPFYFI